MTEMTTTKTRTPSHIAYHVRDGKPGEKGFFNRIGVAFANADGRGFNLVLDCVPLDGRVTLRVLEERDEAAS
jgi:hypothetical protein